MRNELSNYTLLRCLVKIDKNIAAKNNIVIMFKQPISIVHEINPFVNNSFTILRFDANKVRLGFAPKKIGAF